MGKNTWTGNPAPGQDYVYNINVCNNGPTGSTELTLTDTLPTQNTLVGWWGREAGWDEEVGAEGELILTYPSIPGGSCREVYVRVSLDGDAQEGDELVNTAAIFASNDDPDEEDNWTELRHNVGTPYADLSISANWHWGTLVPGGYYRYGISFRNEGNIPINDQIEITATIPEGTSFAGWDHWDWASLIGEPSMIGNTLTWLVDGLDAGYYGTIEVWLNIKSNTTPGTPLIHTVEIEVQPAETYTENNYSGFEEAVFDYGPNLRVRKWGDWHGHGEGHNAWYQLQVENIGTQTIENVVVTDSYPVSMAIDGDMNVGYWQWWDWEDFPEDHYFTITLEKLEPTWNVGINFDVVIPGDDPIPWGQIFTNTATVTLDPNDTNLADNTAEFLLGSGPDMFVEKTLEEGEFVPGEEVSFLLKFGNAQPGHTWWWNMVGIAILADTLPEGMTYVAGSARLHWCGEEGEWCEFSPTIDGQQLTWETWPLGSGGWNEILLTVLVDEDAQVGEELTNTLEIASDQPTVDLDPFLDNNTSIYTGYVKVTTFTIFLPLILK